MFDDPRRELDRLQRQLLAEEEENLEDILEEYGEEDYDTLYGLDIGADDYICKPFNAIDLDASKAVAFAS